MWAFEIHNAWRASPVSIPLSWLQNPSLIEPESKEWREAAWNVLWSIFSRDGEHHPYDRVDQLGGCQDEVNFHYLRVLLARWLDGRPTGKLACLWSPRGRNSKGIVQKMLMYTFGICLNDANAGVQSL